MPQECKESLLKPQLAKLQPLLQEKDAEIERLKAALTEDSVKQSIGSIIKRERNLAVQQERERIFTTLDLHKNELGFCEISNHVPFDALHSEPSNNNCKGICAHCVETEKRPFKCEH